MFRALPSSSLSRFHASDAIPLPMFLWRQASHPSILHLRRKISVSSEAEVAAYSSSASHVDSHHHDRDSLLSSGAAAAASSSIVNKQMEQQQPLRKRWKPLCLYHTQGKCALMSNPAHLDKFNHDILSDLRVKETKLKHLCYNNLDTLLVLDLEGKIEILEFPVLMIDAKSTNCVDFFHRFVRPVRMEERKINEYIDGKYGTFGVDQVWHDTAIPFKQVLNEFEAWLSTHHLLDETNGALHRAGFVICGNWDMKTKIPQQCKDSQIKLPPYFLEWINLKDLYLNYYKRLAPGMRSMLQQLGIQLVGCHHLGIDDAKNIAKVLQHMLSDGCPIAITAKRSSVSENTRFLFENRIDARQHRRQ